MRKLTNLLLVVLLVSGFTLVGCLGDDDDNPSSSSSDLIGTWSLTAMSENGDNIPPEYFGEVTVTINDGGTGTVIEDGVTSNFTWSVSGNKLTVTEDGETRIMDFSVSGNTLTLTFREIYGDDSTGTEEFIMIQTFTKQ
jgi:hypothetical protein